MTDTLTILSYVGGLILAFWCVVGFAMHMRWGTVGLQWVWRHRAQVDRAVRSDMRKVFAMTGTGTQGR